ncbi:hypothetical protein AMTRI_Chr05g73440 [Amborella trichopoda]
MRDSENALPPSKKRVAGRELSRDNPDRDDEDDAPDEESGTFQKASEEVLASRRMVKVRRNPPPTSTASSNPFASVRLVPPSIPPVINEAEPSTSLTETTVVSQEAADAYTSKVKVGSSVVAESKENKEGIEKKSTELSGEATDASINEPNGKKEGGDESKGDTDVPKEASEATDKVDSVKETTDSDETKKDEEEAKKRSEEKTGEGDGNGASTAAAAPFSSFQQLSSGQNAFTGLSGTGFSSSSFSFGTIPIEGSFGSGASTFGGFGLAAGPLFGSNNDKNTKNGSSSHQLFASSTGSNDVTKSSGSSLTPMPEVPLETGEENEKSVFTADAVLFEYLEGGWKERGKGELKLNVSTTDSGRARLVMRARGNYRLILNSNLYPDMKLTNMDKKGITFACVNSASERKDGLSLSTFALKFKDSYLVEEFRGAVTAHKGKQTAVLKTPENSPKASDD